MTKKAFQCEFYMSKIIRSFLIFFSLKNKSLGGDFLLKLFFGTFHFEINFTKSVQIFDDVAKLRKASWNAYNQGGWLILQNLLKNWIAKGVAS